MKLYIYIEYGGNVMSQVIINIAITDSPMQSGALKLNREHHACMVINSVFYIQL